MMKILFDHQIFMYPYGGAPKYFTKLLSHLPQGVWDTSVLLACTEYAKGQSLFPYMRKCFRGEPLLLDYIHRPYTCMKTLLSDYDVFHQTNFGTYMFPFVKRPLVITYHDANLSTIDPHPEIVKRQKASAKRADAVICVSENTKKDFLDLFDVDERKVHVIYHGIERLGSAGLQEESLYPFPYILYVGRRSRYKNFHHLAIAFSRLHPVYPDIRLVCTSAAFSDEERAFFHELGIEDSIVAISADEPTMRRLYRDALCFVFPSYYEGFGMPILEAWDMDCPVILSDRSCFPEIAGDAALYFDADDPDELRTTIERVICSEDIRRDLIRKGAERITHFSWEKCAEKHLQVYKSLT